MESSYFRRTNQSTTLDSEIKYKKRSVLEGFVINMTPFFKNAEPHDKANKNFYNDNDAIEIPIELLPLLILPIRERWQTII